LEFRILSYYKINLSHYAEKRKVYHYRHMHELSLGDDFSFSFERNFHKEILYWQPHSNWQDSKDFVNEH